MTTNQDTISVPWSMELYEGRISKVHGILKRASDEIHGRNIKTSIRDRKSYVMGPRREDVWEVQKKQ